MNDEAAVTLVKKFSTGIELVDGSGICEKTIIFDKASVDLSAQIAMISGAPVFIRKITHII